MTIIMRKRSDVEAEANRRARELQKQRPETYGGKSLAAARSAVYAESPGLRDALASFPSRAGETAAPTIPVEKGAPALAKRDAAVRELRKLYPHETEGQLRTRALQENPEIYDEYRRLSDS